MNPEFTIVSDVLGHSLISALVWNSISTTWARMRARLTVPARRPIELLGTATRH